MNHRNSTTAFPEQWMRHWSREWEDYQIYATTVQENVMMHSAEDGDEKRVEEASGQSGFSGGLKTLPAGMKTTLTREFDEKGVQLSGGEVQKVAIARLFAKKERIQIAILDEPSSALDPRAE